MVDSRGQVSLEYLLIFLISLILLITFTMPMMELSVKNTLDVSDSLNMKAQLSKIAHAVEQVYGEGQNSRHSVNVDSPASVKLNIESSYISCSMKLKDNSKKSIRVNVDSALESSALSLDKGENSIIVEWPENSENMIIYTD